MGNIKKITPKKSTRIENDVVFNRNEPKWYTVSFLKNFIPVTFWCSVFLLLFFFLQKQLAFHFFYIEQEQLFLWSFNYFTSFMIEPGGFSRWLTEFFVQFFIQPYCGSLIMSSLFTIIGILTAAIIKRIAPKSNLFIWCLLPIVLLLFVHFDTNYFYRGTMSYMLMLLVLYGYFCIRNVTARIIYVTVFSVLLFWCAGAVAFLFVVCTFIWELLNRFSKAFLFILPVLFIVVLAFCCVYFSLVGGFRFLLLPDGYYTYQLHPTQSGMYGVAIYFSWIFLPILLLLCRFLHNRKYVSGLRKILEIFLQFFLVVLFFFFGIEKFANRNSDFYKELDYFMRTEQWDSIIKRCSGESKNYLYKCCLNVALAEKGELAERMFSFDQRGIQSIIVPWNRTVNVSVLLSEIYFSMGHIAMAQRMAFEANECMPNANGSRMLKRLVQTNLIYGAFPIAERYIDLLEQTLYYKEWADEQRRFLWNDDAIEKDSLLSMKRHCILKLNHLSELQGLHVDLENIAKQNPSHPASIQFAGAFYLLTKEIALFQEFIENFHATNVLPTLPKSYQEAIVIFSEDDTLLWKEYGISDSVIQRFTDFRRQYMANRNNTTGLPGLLKKSFGDTYWYYYMFK